ncbi:MAG: hypothetical protein QOE70_2255 [Chthoniobacter sp.]|jgi:hypothetical protein|nr:hypothetical protein [Chthoniobacter sp.]
MPTKLGLYELLIPQFPVGINFIPDIDRVLALLDVEELTTSFDETDVVQTGRVAFSELAGPGPLRLLPADAISLAPPPAPPGTPPPPKNFFEWEDVAIDFRLTIPRDGMQAIDAAAKLIAQQSASDPAAAELDQLFTAFGAHDAAVTEFPGIRFRLELLFSVLTFHLGKNWEPGKVKDGLVVRDDELITKQGPDVKILSRKSWSNMSRATTSAARRRSGSSRGATPDSTRRGRAGAHGAADRPPQGRALLAPTLPPTGPTAQPYTLVIRVEDSARTKNVFSDTIALTVVSDPNSSPKKDGALADRPPESGPRQKAVLNSEPAEMALLPAEYVIAHDPSSSGVSEDIRVLHPDDLELGVTVRGIPYPIQIKEVIGANVRSTIRLDVPPGSDAAPIAVRLPGCFCSGRPPLEGCVTLSHRRHCEPARCSGAIFSASAWCASRPTRGRFDAERPAGFRYRADGLPPHRRHFHAARRPRRRPLERARRACALASGASPDATQGTFAGALLQTIAPFCETRSWRRCASS